jgi:hypothetical protein
MNLKDYPPDWAAISLKVRLRAQGQCECAGECGRAHVGRCEALNGIHGARHRETDRWRSTAGLIAGVERHGENDSDYSGGSMVVLTAAHLWRGPCAEHDAAGVKCGDPEHLKAMCQACHLSYDLPHHVARRKQNRFAKKALGDLFG